jgi:predicted phosphohydrolase
MQKYAVKRCYYGHLHSASVKKAVQGERFGINFCLVSADKLYIPYNLLIHSPFNQKSHFHA